VTNRLASKTRYWWLLLIAGVIWIVIGLAIPRFAYATVTTLAIALAFLVRGVGRDVAARR
jgi:uncharacterized membrane protein HdeD (DUF308 family)